MSIYHLEAQIIGRSEGRNAVACAAYRAGEKLYCEETQAYKNFDRKQHITYKAIMLPPNAPREYADRATLWNAVQKIEKNKNAQLCREFNIALPIEFSEEQQIAVLNEFLQPLVDRGMIADIAIHDIKGNPHAHVMLTMRAMDEQGKWLPKKVKKYILDENGNKIPELDKKGIQKKEKNGKKIWKYETVSTTDWDNTDLINDMRASWAKVCNQHLAPDKHIDHRSHKARGLDILPTVHIGVAAAALERKGIRTERGNKNRRIKEYNAYVTKMQTELDEAAKRVMEKAEQLRKEQSEIARKYLEQIAGVGKQQQETATAIATIDREAQQRAASIRAAIAGAREMVQPILNAGANPAQGAGREMPADDQRPGDKGSPVSIPVPGNGAGAAGAAETAGQPQGQELEAQIAELNAKKSDYKRNYIRDRYKRYNTLMPADHEKMLYKAQLLINQDLIQARYIAADILTKQAEALEARLYKEIEEKQKPANTEISRLKAELAKDTKDWQEYSENASIFDKMLGIYKKNEETRAQRVQETEDAIATLERAKEDIKHEYASEISSLKTLNRDVERLKTKIPTGFNDTIKSAKYRHDEYLEDFQKILARRPELKENKAIRNADQQWRLHTIQKNIDSAISRKVQVNPQYQERVAQKAAKIEQARRAKAAAQKATATPNRSRSRSKSRDDDYSR